MFEVKSMYAIRTEMTTEDAISYLKWARPIKPYSLDKKRVQEAIDMAIKVLSAEKTAEWISVRKQKPEDYEEVIATVRYDYKGKQEYEVVTGVRYSKEDGWEWAYEAGADYYVSLDEEVVAWQPLPNPYEVKR